MADVSAERTRHRGRTDWHALHSLLLLLLRDLTLPRQPWRFYEPTLLSTHEPIGFNDSNTSDMKGIASTIPHTAKNARRGLGTWLSMGSPGSTSLTIPVRITRTRVKSQAQ